MTRTMLVLTITLLTAAVAGASPVSAAYIMVSGGTESGDAGFAGANPVLFIPVPDYVPGTVIAFDPAGVAGYDDAWVDASQIWFLGGDMLDDPGLANDATPLFLSQDAPLDISFEEKIDFLEALNRIVGFDPNHGEAPEPFSMPWDDYSGTMFGGLGIDFLSGGPLVFPSSLGPVGLSFSLSSPSTEVDIIEHSPPFGLPILLTVDSESSGLVTGIRATVLPEPGSLALLALGLGALGLAAHRRRRRT